MLGFYWCVRNDWCNDPITGQKTWLINKRLHVNVQEGSFTDRENSLLIVVAGQEAPNLQKGFGATATERWESLTGPLC
jgi:hypothetical protein